MTTDGRVARRWRNQDTVLDAVICLFDAGHAEPAVEEVSAASGVSTRSIYRYFHHREGLIDAAVWHLVDRVEADGVQRVSDGPLDRRIAAFVNNRLSVFARIAPLVRASKRLARPLSGAPRSGDESDDLRPNIADGHRSLFAVAPSIAFAGDFDRGDSASRKIAEISADAMFRFDTLDDLAETLASDPTLMATVLERHLRQQIASV